MARTGQNCIGTEIFMSIAVLAPSTSASSTAVLELKSCSEEMQDCSLSNRVLYSLENKYKILVLHFPPLSKENFLESLIGKGISEMSQKWWPLLPTSDFHEQYYCCFPGLSLWHPGRWAEPQACAPALGDLIFLWIFNNCCIGENDSYFRDSLPCRRKWFL